MQKFCETCGLANKSTNQCGLNGMPIDPKIDYCSHHCENPEVCEVCGNIILKLNSMIEYCDGEYHMICTKCNQLLNTCQACSKFQQCAFETDPNPLPKQVVKQVQQGNMVMQTVVKNEERVKAICPSCDCWHEEGFCLKEFNMGCMKKDNFWKSRKS